MASDTASSPRDAVDRVRELLGARVRVGTRHGRSFDGALSCVDPQGSMILEQAAEDGRGSIGQILILARDITSATLIEPAPEPRPTRRSDLEII